MALFLFESLIPAPLPWLKPGLANLGTVVTLYLFGARAAMLVAFLRSVLSALVLGTFLNPVFLFSLCGGMAAAAIMGLVKHRWSGVFSAIGISVLGAYAHNLTQLLLASLLFVNKIQALYLMPVMLVSALFSGSLVGIFAHYLVNIAREILPNGSMAPRVSH